MFEIVQKRESQADSYQRLNLAVFACSMALTSTRILIQKSWPYLVAGLLWAVVGIILAVKLTTPREKLQAAAQIIVGLGLVVLVLVRHRHPVL
jgi:hypothetical protein